MKQLYRGCLGLLLLVCLAILPARQIFAQEQETDFSITQQKMVAEIAADGSVAVVDRFTYEITHQGSIQFRLDTQDSNLIRYAVGIQTADDAEVRYYTESYTGVPETYRVSQGNQYTDFTVYPSAYDEPIELVFEYTLEGPVTNYLDTAIFSQLMVGDTVAFNRSFSSEIHLPGIVTNEDNFRAWVQGVPEAVVTLTEKSSRSVIQIEVPELAASQTLEVNGVFPTSLTPNNSAVVEETVKDAWIKGQETQLEADISLYKSGLTRATVWMIVAMIAAPALVGVSFGYYWMSRRKLNPNPKTLPAYYHQLPDEEMTPAIMATSVLRERPTGADFVATIIDLTRRGYLSLEEVRKEKRGVFVPGQSSTLKISVRSDAPATNILHTHEHQVIGFLTPDGVSGATTLEELEERSKHSKPFRKQQLAFWKKFNDYGELRGMQVRGGKNVQATRSARLASFAMLGSLLAGGVSIYFSVRLGVTGLVVLAFLLAVVTVTASAVMIWLNRKHPIVTAEFDRIRQQWAGFKLMLADSAEFDMAEIAPLSQWEAYLSYAVSLGVAEELLAAMKKQFKRAEFSGLKLAAKLYSNPALLNTVLPQSITATLAAIDPTGMNTGMGLGAVEED